MKPFEIFKNLAVKGDAPGLIGPLDAKLAYMSRVYYAMPTHIAGTTSGAAAVNDICNRLLAQGATPRFLAATFTISSTFTADEATTMAESIRTAAVQAEVEIASVDVAVTGEHLPSAVQMSMAAIGEQRPDCTWGFNCIRPGDVIICTGAVGTQGAALMESRLDAQFMPPVASDTASLGDIVHALQNVTPAAIRALYYPADGFSSAIEDMRAATGLDVEIDAAAVPVAPAVKAACKSVGVSAYDIECAGVMLAVVAADKADEAVAAVKRSAHGAQGAIVGRFL